VKGVTIIDLDLLVESSIVDVAKTHGAERPLDVLINCVGEEQIFGLCSALLFALERASKLIYTLGQKLPLNLCCSRSVL
jgi:hypothetical protein